MPSTVILLDVSLSMGKPYSDLLPSKLDAAIQAIAKASTELIARKYRVGLVFYAGWVLPLVPPTREQRHLYRALSLVNKTYEGSAPGEAVIEAIRLLRPLPDADKSIMLVTDGDYNIGVPLSYAIEAAYLNNIRLIILHIGDPQTTKIGSLVEQYSGKTEWITVRSRSELNDALLGVVSEE
jgi:uncharacterized protein (DUF58 family)